MKPESVKQMQQFLDARDLLRSAREQYETATRALARALNAADTAVISAPDPEAAQAIAAMSGLVETLPHEALAGIDVIVETLEVLAAEVTAREEHLPAGVS